MFSGFLLFRGGSRILLEVDDVGLEAEAVEIVKRGKAKKRFTAPQTCESVAFSFWARECLLQARVLP
jgi:hypothetical protein